ncbi:MAG: leucine-rich repeat domain-containing protein [Cryomorphaceae bacterium]|jgi:Leucine-rich repeat (LRR) protein|nr:leucine-rich repeat domain-containing protein [Cryomorphaceae bacterium]
MQEEFNAGKLYNLISDKQNLEQNILFLQVFSPETVDELWNKMNPFSEGYERKSGSLMQLLLIAFGAEGSFPAAIRNGQVHSPIRNYPKEKTLVLGNEFYDVPEGVVSQIVESLNIKHLIIESEAALAPVFDKDFRYIADFIRSCAFFRFESNYQFPEFFLSSKKIEELRFVAVRGAILPTDLSRMTSLVSYELIDANTEVVPKFDLIYKNLRHLNLSQSITSNVTSEVFDVAELPIKLESIDLSACYISKLKGFEQLNSLRKINLSNCIFSELNFHEFPATLERLDLRSNQMASFPSLKNCSELSLIYIDLSYNQLTSIPEDLSPLKNLKEFLCSHNQLENLPSNIIELEHLERIDVRRNKLTTLPQSLKSLKKLFYIDLEDNFLSNVSPVIQQWEIPDAKVALRGNNFDNNEKKQLLEFEHLKLDL